MDKNINNLIFLVYKENYAGLCNQLYLITNHITNAIEKNTKIYIPKINIDIFCNKRVPLNEVIDISKTNKNINIFLNKNINILCDILPPGMDWYTPNLNVYPVKNISILNCIEFQKKFKIDIKEKYNAIHFRLDIDCIVSYLYPDKYNYFMDLSFNDKLNHSQILGKSEEVINYCHYLLKQYFDFITTIGFDLPFYICNTIEKDIVHDSVLWTLNTIINFIERKGGKIIKSFKYHSERELNALVDLLILRDCNSMIGFEGSSFSEGYVYKVNSIRAPGKKYYFVNGIVPINSSNL